MVATILIFELLYYYRSLTSCLILSKIKQFLYEFDDINLQTKCMCLGQHMHYDVMMEKLVNYTKIL